MIQPYLFGDYPLLDRISVGGMAEVFCARHARTRRRTRSVKRLLPHLAMDRRTTAMFSHEAQLANLMDHPGVVASRDHGQVGTDHFIALEYVSGPDCQAVLRAMGRNKDPLPLELVAYLFEKMAKALGYVHGLRDGHGRPLNIVHMDVTPENILVSYEGDIRLTDFGISTSHLSTQHDQSQAMKGNRLHFSGAGTRATHRPTLRSVFSGGQLRIRGRPPIT